MIIYKNQIIKVLRIIQIICLILLIINIIIDRIFLYNYNSNLIVIPCFIISIACLIIYIILNLSICISLKIITKKTIYLCYIDNNYIDNIPKEEKINI